MAGVTAPRNPASIPAAFARAVDLSALGKPAEPESTSGPEESSPHVLTVTEANFGDVVARSSQVPVVIDLWASWCQPCQQLGPLLEKLAAEGQGTWVLAKVDVDTHPRIAQAFGVQSIPTVVALAAGQPVDAFTGAQPEPQLRAWIQNLLATLRDKLPGIAEAEQAAGGPVETPRDERITAAEALLEAGDLAGAQTAYEVIVAAEPHHAEAAAALIQVRFTRRVAELGPQVVAEADADPLQVAKACAAADWQVAAGESALAFERLIKVVRSTDGQQRSAVREHLISLFELFSADDAAVLKARRDLVTALY